MATMKVDAGTPGWQQRHVALYLKTDGAEGHLVNFGRPGMTEVPCLLLQTTGRKSHTAQTTPLIYGKDGNGFVIIASKGGAPAHPAWYLNLSDDAEVKFQVGAKKYRGTARTAPSPDRERLYAMMTKIFPPYRDYQEKTPRQIPVVVLEPKEEIAQL
ncbi:MAG TPA: nitroreductase family deazaflavin-dependent oxidoreductase [Stellaceae bacterium]|nr:nitroreductase family deazaflavin-dependent oxidoreductase [Stellaceae bacterium]